MRVAGGFAAEREEDAIAAPRAVPYVGRMPSASDFSPLSRPTAAAPHEVAATCRPRVLRTALAFVLTLAACDAPSSSEYRGNVLIQTIPDSILLQVGESVQMQFSAATPTGEPITDLPANALVYVLDMLGGNPIATATPGGLITAIAGGFTYLRISSAYGAVNKVVPIGVDGPPYDGNTNSFTTVGRSTHSIVVDKNNRVIIGDPGRLGLQMRLPYQAVSSWYRDKIADLAYVQGESSVYAARNNDAYSSSVEEYPTDAPVRTFPASGVLSSIAVDADLDAIFVGNKSGLLRRIARTAGPDSVIPLGSEIRGIVTHPTDDRVYVTTSAGDLHEVDGATMASLRSVPLGKEPGRMAIVHDGSTLLVVRDSGSTLALNLSDLSIAEELTKGNNGRDVVVAPDGQRFVVTKYDPVTTFGSVIYYETATLDFLSSRSAPQAERAAFSKSGATLVVTSRGNQLVFLR